MTVKAGDKLQATIECPSCGGECSMSVTKNKTIFAYCRETVDAETGEKCGYRAFLGRTRSREIIKEYQNAIQEQPDDKSINEEESTEVTEREQNGGNDTRGTRNATEREHRGHEQPDQHRERSGFRAGLKHFLTGDE